MKKEIHIEKTPGRRNGRRMRLHSREQGWSEVLSLNVDGMTPAEVAALVERKRGELRRKAGVLTRLEAFRGRKVLRVRGEEFLLTDAILVRQGSDFSLYLMVKDAGGERVGGFPIRRVYPDPIEVPPNGQIRQMLIAAIEAHLDSEIEDYEDFEGAVIDALAEDP